MNDIEQRELRDTRHAVAEGVAKAIQAATADAKVGTIIVKKLVVSVYENRGGGAEMTIRNYAYKHVAN